MAPDELEDGALDLEVLLHPNLPALYRRQIERLADNIQRPDSEEAFMLLRSMIDRVELVPRKAGKGLDAVLYGELAAILTVCTEAAGKGRRPASGEAGRQPSVVAGAGFEPTTSRL